MVPPREPRKSWDVILWSLAGGSGLLAAVLFVASNSARNEGDAMVDFMMAVPFTLFAVGFAVAGLISSVRKASDGRRD